jgi:hypothetical protein
MIKLTDKIVSATLGHERQFREGYGKRFPLILICDNDETHYYAGEFFPDTGVIQLYGFPATAAQLVEISIAVKLIS